MALPRWVATRSEVITRPMVLGPSFVTPPALATPLLVLARCSPTPPVSRTRLLGYKRSLEIQPDSITPPVVLPRFRETQRETRHIELAAEAISVSDNGSALAEVRVVHGPGHGDHRTVGLERSHSATKRGKARRATVRFAQRGALLCRRPGCRCASHHARRANQGLWVERPITLGGIQTAPFVQNPVAARCPVAPAQ